MLKDIVEGVEFVTECFDNYCDCTVERMNLDTPTFREVLAC